MQLKRFFSQINEDEERRQSDFKQTAEVQVT
jgi:hypothetical protein